jgi:type IV pilus assembly protein PilX
MRENYLRRQSGSTLIICLVFLLILTMIGISSIQNSTLQEQMAGSARDYNSAFQAAESALRKGEEYLQQATLGAFSGSGGRYTICSDPTSTATECAPPSWQVKTSSGWVDQSGVANVNSQPQFILEKYPLIIDVNAPIAADEVPVTIDMYRVTARGYGVSENSMVVLQSAFRR